MHAIFLPIELRERIVAAYERGEGTCKQTAQRFRVGVSGINRYIRRSRRGELSSLAHGGGLPPSRGALILRVTQAAGRLSSHVRLKTGSRPSARFDFNRSFQAAFGSSFDAFLRACFIACIAKRSSKERQFFARDYVAGCASGLDWRDKERELHQAFERLTMDRPLASSTYRKMGNKDRRFAPYDFNPLRIYPIKAHLLTF